MTFQCQNAIHVFCKRGRPASRSFNPTRLPGNRGGRISLTPKTVPLPATPPAPGVLVRDSFGIGAGGSAERWEGDAEDYVIAGSINGFWIEYPGSKNTLGLTDSALLQRNMETSGHVWLVLRSGGSPFTMHYELRADGVAGPFSRRVRRTWNGIAGSRFATTRSRRQSAPASTVSISAPIVRP